MQTEVLVLSKDLNFYSANDRATAWQLGSASCKYFIKILDFIPEAG
jgi:hypothetical protein